MKNRTIKFRAWDKKEKQMSDDFLAGGQNDDWQTWLNDDVFRDKNYIFLQFTGLHDKNGKEIYEGDVVQRFFSPFVGTDYKHSKPRVVEWKETKHYNGFNIGKSSNGKQTQWEVIGNIWEHPHLLESSVPHSPQNS